MKKHFWPLFGITILVLAISFLCIYPDKMFGSVTDWGSQHTMIPEYFRTSFYQTGNLFPDFMMNLGAGQNIYNISYYGLLNPIVLLSYFFPFIKMVDFMIVMSIGTVLLSIYLFYYWLWKKGFSRLVVIISTLIFSLSAPLLFHSHRHIMFVTYMPFLILGLIAIEAYFEKQKRGLLTLSVLGMILTSYYYSIGGIVVFLFYGITCYVKNNKVTFKKFILDGFRFLSPILLGIGLSMVLLLPTAYVIFNGREGGSTGVEITKLFLPHLDLDALLYGNYSIGLSAIAVIALFHTLFTKKREQIMLGIFLLGSLSIPFFMYLLNGFLYVRAKALIPFLPLFVFLIAIFLQDCKEKKINFKLEMMILLLLSCFWYWRGYHKLFFFLDLFLCFFFIFLYQKRNNKWFYLIPIGIVSLIVAFVSNKAETFQNKKEYQNAFHKDKQSLIKETIKKDTDFYRFLDLTDTLLTVNKVYDPRYYSTTLYSSTFHKNYKDFFYNQAGNADTYRNNLVTSASDNIFFEKLMNIKYVVAKKGEQPIGYSPIKEKGEYGVYQNEFVYPLGYATNQIYQKEFFQSLEYPYNMELLMHGVVALKGKKDFQSKIEEIHLSYPEKIEGLDVSKSDNQYKVTTDRNRTFKIPLTEQIGEQELLLIKFTLTKSQNCKEGDLSIAINGISNKLTCKQWLYHNGNYTFEYAIKGGIEELSVSMSKGTFEIAEIKTYKLDYETFKENSKKVDPLLIQKQSMNGEIEGKIQVKNDGYFVLSIPYDEAFTILLDSKKVNFEMVNETFIGFPIKRGQHTIKIIYQAPFKREGLLISGGSFVFLILMIYFDYKRTKV